MIETRQEKPVWRAITRYVKRASWALLRADKAELQRERHRLALQLLRRDAESITFRRDGTLWTAFVWDTNITKSLFEQGGYQSADIEALLNWLERRGLFPADRPVIVDVGANIGTTSIPLAQLTGRKILSIEPVPENFALLRQNAAQNGLSTQITCVHAAVSTSKGTVQMVLNDRNCGGAEIKAKDTVQGFGKTSLANRVVEVPTDTLAGTLSAQSVTPRKVAFVWSDTQGFEAQVIESGATLWQAGVPLYAELWPAGLRAHGGTAALATAAEKHFNRFVTREALVAGDNPEPRPIDELPSVLAAIPGNDFTDALFLPASRD